MSRTSTILNTAVKLIYWILIAVPVLLLAISVYSYLSVYLTFGSVPSSEDYTQELIGSSGKSFHIFPTAAGSVIIDMYFYSIIAVPIFLSAILFIKYLNRELRFRKGLAICLVGIHLFMSILFDTDVLWYVKYVLD